MARGGPGGGSPADHGRGGGRGRGRGRGRGGRGNGPVPGSRSIEDGLDFSIQMFADAPSSGGRNTPRGRGRGRGGRGGRGGQFSGTNSGSITPNRGRGRGRGGFDSPRGRGFESPRGRGRGEDSFTSSRRGAYGIGASPRGRGQGGGQPRPGTLSGLLYQERPLLRPIKFVPSVLTKVLFEEEEELIKPGVEDVDDTEQSHVPTADQVSRVFSGGNVESESEEDEEGEEIEEVDFNEVEKLFDSNTTTKTTTTIRKSKLAETTTILEERFTGFYNDANPFSKPDEVADLAKMMEETLSAAKELDHAEDTPMEEETLQDFSTASPREAIVVDDPESELFYVDVQPTMLPAEIAPSQNLLPPSLRDDDDDIIVYVAPHPRKASSNDAEERQAQAEEKAASNAPDTSLFTPYISAAVFPLASSSTVPPMPEPPSFSSISFSFSRSTTAPVTPGRARLQLPPVSTPRQAKAWNRKRGLKKKKAKPSFGAFGAMREEEQLHRQDPRRSERRRDDSDLEWGDTDDENLGADEVEEGLEDFIGLNFGSSGTGKGKGKGKDKERILAQDKGKGKARDEENNGMEVDPEITSDLAAMRSFVGGLLGRSAGVHATMDDIRDVEMMRMEDEEDDGGTDTSGDEEEDEVLIVEEALLISESLDFDDDKLEDGSSDSEDTDDDEDDDDETPRTSFQARLERLREKSRSKKPADTSMEDMPDDSDEDADDFLTRNMTCADEDEDFIQEIQDILDENEDVLTGRDRKQRNALFRSIRNGAFDDVEDMIPAKRRKDKGKDLPEELQMQWENDRKKKAGYKQARALARLEAAADPISKKKGGRKGRKAMLAAAKLDPTINVIPNRIIDMATLVQQIRRFIAEVGGPSTMSLPPTNKATRKNIHEMAIAFNLKSLSKGKGDSRYTTLTKTTRSGFGVDEQKVSKIVRRSGGIGARGDSFIYESKGRGPPAAMPRHREGDEVGKAAPKLTQTNIGFRMLALMGWQEGVRIGFTGGLDAPLTAIIKNSKLGLGATR